MKSEIRWLQSLMRIIFARPKLHQAKLDRKRKFGSKLKIGNYRNQHQMMMIRMPENRNVKLKCNISRGRF